MQDGGPEAEDGGPVLPSSVIPLPSAVPSLAAFLAAPSIAVAAVAPASVLLAVGGSRRAAALAGVGPHTDAYAHYARDRMMAMWACLFRHGVTHIFSAAIRPGQLAETGPYREKLLRWNDQGLAGEAALADYARLGWRVRLLGVEDVPELQDTAARLIAATPDRATHTVWWIVNRTAGSPWEHLLAAALREGARTQAEAIRALYGEDLPPISMMLSFGKPMIVPDIVPPVLIGDMQCYWYQRPGYAIDDQTFRRIMYDYAYVRPTWRSNRDHRYDEMERQRALWDNDIVLGLGRRVADFWFPNTGEE